MRENRAVIFLCSGGKITAEPKNCWPTQSRSLHMSEKDKELTISEEEKEIIREIEKTKPPDITGTLQLVRLMANLNAKLITTVKHETD